MDHVFRLADSPGDLLTRTQGERMREELKRRINKLPNGDQLVIDFSDIQVMTPSFADECLGKLGRDLGEERFRARVRLRNAAAKIRTLVNIVLADRLSPSK